MSSRPTSLQMLPADGTVLEELISDLKTEYGTPATPQEYRLTIRILGEERERPGLPVEEEGAAEKGPVAETEGQSSSSRRRSRRRGRRRRHDGSQDQSEAAEPAEAVILEIPEDPEP